LKGKLVKNLYAGHAKKGGPTYREIAILSSGREVGVTKRKLKDEDKKGREGLG